MGLRGQGVFLGVGPGGGGRPPASLPQHLQQQHQARRHPLHAGQYVLI